MEQGSVFDARHGKGKERVAGEKPELPLDDGGSVVKTAISGALLELVEADALEFDGCLVSHIIWNWERYNKT